VPNPDDGELVLMAAGERIVAFKLPGKPSNPPFYRQIERVPRTANTPKFREIATVSKARWGRDGAV
jgi:hypothetical protein